jgi:cell fate (sporulation/competence/biofilm development) regulator YlbF (YheA/YmcA/DUF963 family)
MNVYDQAHNLASAIKESQEWKDFNSVRKEAEADEQFMQMLSDLQAKQIEMQTAQLTGQEVNPDLASQMQSIYSMLTTKPFAAKYLEAEARLSMMMKDVFEILGDTMNIKLK